MNRQLIRRWRCGQALLLLASLLCAPAPTLGHGTIPPSLQGAKPPDVPGLLSGRQRIIRSRRHALMLGKALFWDIQVGSDGVACATCHYHAGTDARLTNQLSPGHAPASRPSAATFETLASGAAGGPNYVLQRSDFPFHQLADPADFSSQVLFTSDDVVGSAGSFGGAFRGSVATSAVDDCVRAADPIFNVQGVGTRQVTSRNAPSVINAVFNRRLFWDGHARNVFNGVNPRGDGDPDAGVWVWERRQLTRARLGLPNTALASQAVAPPIDTAEMSCHGRTLADIGRKLLSRRALQLQEIASDDSVLGEDRDASGRGLALTYEKLVRKAFRRRYWGAPRARAQNAFGTPAAGGTPYTQMEANFAMFFGLAIQLYESTLISDQAPFDSPRDAQGVPSALDEQQRRGLAAFVDFHCAECHSGPTLAGAVQPRSGTALTEVDRKPIRTAAGASVLGLVDTAFVNTGVVPLDHDAGVGGTDVTGRPLSLTAQYLDLLAGAVPPVDPMIVQSCAMTVPFAAGGFGQPPFAPAELVADPAGATACAAPANAQVPSPQVTAAELALPEHGRLTDGTVGAFKVPSLRNVELTGPYMHNGGMATLEEVLEFYNRGGNVTSHGKDAQFLFGQGLSAETMADIVAFLKSLTDERVRWERAPFDHPALPLAAGHVGDANAVEVDQSPELSGMAKTRIVNLPAVGREGRSAATGPLEALTDRFGR